MSIFEEVKARIQSGNNIKHLTLNTKHLTLDTNTLDLPSGEGETSDLLRLKPPSGLAPEVLSPQVGVSSSGEVIPALVNADFQYIAVSLKTQTKEERIEVNVDFKLQNSTTFNKLVFNLVGWNRRREFFDNIQEVLIGMVINQHTNNRPNQITLVKDALDPNRKKEQFSVLLLEKKQQ